MKNKKILVFIKKNNNELLLLHGSDKDPQFRESFWYTVTGSVEPCDKTLMDAVKREVKEETNLDIQNILYLNWILIYESLGATCEEYVFIADVINAENVTLNEENVEYKWLNANKFVDEIKWYGDKRVLELVLKSALDNKKYLDVELKTTM